MLTDQDLEEILETVRPSAFGLSDDELLHWLRLYVVHLLDYIAELKAQSNPDFQATVATAEIIMKRRLS